MHRLLPIEDDPALFNLHPGAGRTGMSAKPDEVRERLLLAEDEPSLAELLAQLLGREAIRSNSPPTGRPPVTARRRAPVGRLVTRPPA